MEFNIKLEDKEYLVEPVGSDKVSYRIHDGDESYNLKMDSTGEWICDAAHFEMPPIPVDEIGKEIEKYFG
jgi:hypothetical protein